MEGSVNEKGKFHSSKENHYFIQEVASFERTFCQNLSFYTDGKTHNIVTPWLWALCRLTNNTSGGILQGNITPRAQGLFKKTVNNSMANNWLASRIPREISTGCPCLCKHQSTCAWQRKWSKLTGSILPQNVLTNSWRLTHTDFLVN